MLSDDTDTYKDNLLQKYGMAKWQVSCQCPNERMSVSYTDMRLFLTDKGVLRVPGLKADHLLIVST